MPSSVGRRSGAQECGLELEPVGPVVHPRASVVDELAGADRGGGTKHRDQIPLAADLDTQHAEAAVRVVERHPLDQAGQVLGGIPC
jgi:hypothetical protein